MLKIGLIGAGYMGSMHSSCYKALEGAGVKISAVSDANAENAQKVAQIHGAQILSADALIASPEVDAVDICLPTSMHTQYAVSAMRAGKAVFIEKPVCLTLEEAELLLKTQKETGVQVMVGQVIRFWNEYVWIKKAVDSGEYGTVRSVVLKRVSARPDWAWNNWLHSPEQSGSVALDMHVHDVDFLRCLLGEPTALQSTAERDGNGLIEQIFTGYTYPNGVAAASEACWAYPKDFPFCMEIRVRLTGATMGYDSANGLNVYPAEGGHIVPQLDAGPQLGSQDGGNISDLGGYFNELKYFVEQLNQKKPIETACLEDAVKSLKLTLQEIQSAGGLIQR